jgi:hypothetical protein
MLPEALPSDLHALPIGCTESSTTAIVAAPDRNTVLSAPAINLNEPGMQKHTVEVRIGRDEDDCWWVVVIVDANGQRSRAARTIRKSGSREKEGLTLAAEIDDLEDEDLRHFIAERGLPPTRH